MATNTTKGVQRQDTHVPENTLTKQGVLLITSSEEDAELFTDTKFMGNLPTKLKLAEGTHMIELKKPGYKAYKKEITISGDDELTIHAIMVKE